MAGWPEFFEQLIAKQYERRDFGGVYLVIWCECDKVLRISHFLPAVQ